MRTIRCQAATFPNFSMTISPIASIVDPDMVELPEEAKESRWPVVPSREVLSRYVEIDYRVPEIDFADLDELGMETSEEFDILCELRDEDASE